MPFSIRSRVFYAMRNFDVELAEMFAAKCPEVETIGELNKVFHRLLSQYDVDTRALRQSLSDDIDIDCWINRLFNDGIFNFIQTHRFPPITGNWGWGVYNQQNDDAAKRTV